MYKTKEDIKVWLDTMGIEKYTINEDLTVDVNGSVALYNKSLEVLPVQFGVTEGFDCSDNNLTSLKGCPHTVNGYFSCSNNLLPTLENSPKNVYGAFACDSNKLTSLKGAPQEVHTFDCSHNLLTSLEFSPVEVSQFICSENKLTSLKGCPNIVTVDFDCSNNLLTSLEFSPSKTKSFRCNNNQIQNLEHAPLSVEIIFSIQRNPIKTFEHLMDKNIGHLLHLCNREEDRTNPLENYYKYHRDSTHLYKERAKGNYVYELYMDGSQIKSILLQHQLNNELKNSSTIEIKKPKI